MLESQEPGIVRAARSLNRYLPSALGLSGSVGLALFGIMASVNPGEKNGNWSWTYSTPYGWGFIASASLCFVGGIASLQQHKHTASLEKKLKALEKEFVDKRKICTQIFNAELLTLWEILDFGNSERISIYGHINGNGNKAIEESGFFVILGTYSYNAVYSRPRRKVYPENQGCIGLAYEYGEIFINNFPDPREEINYFGQIEERLKLPVDIARERVMHPRSYAGYGIDAFSGERTAVVVFESTEPQGLNKRRLDRLMREDGELSRLARLLKESFVPRPDYAAREEY